MADEGGAADPGAINPTPNTVGCNNRNSGGKNVRVNQDCTFRRQAEELIKVNPTNPNNLIAGQNDSRVGWNKCGFDYSFDGGKTWGDGLPPLYQRLNNPPTGHTMAGGRGTGHSYDAASDPALAFDSQGNAFFSCVTFDVNTDASAVIVTRSPKEAGGSFYNNVPASGSQYIVVEDNSPNFFHDKEFIVADAGPTSRFRDNVYVTWTVFEFGARCARPPALTGYCSSAIYFSRSTDHANTWSAPKEISGNNSQLCFLGNYFDPRRQPNDCSFDQGSDPIVLSDGTIVVVFNNGNTAATNPNDQQLSVFSTDGGMTWSRPTKVGDDFSYGQPLCNFGRGPEPCIPGAWIRTNDFPRIAVGKSNDELFVTWQDYRTGNLDIHLSRSLDFGATWEEGGESANPTDDVERSYDHYMPAIDLTASGRVAVSYYRTPNVPNEGFDYNLRHVFTKSDPGVKRMNSDIHLAGGSELLTPYRTVKVSPDFPPPDGVQEGFNGDYSGLVVVGETAHPIWSDTRNAALTTDGQGVIHDEDIWTDALPVPANR
jgi:hypothetical protein